MPGLRQERRLPGFKDRERARLKNSNPTQAGSLCYFNAVAWWLLVVRGLLFPAGDWKHRSTLWKINVAYASSLCAESTENSLCFCA
jgi:hypothetical protein